MDTSSDFAFIILTYFGTHYCNLTLLFITCTYFFPICIKVKSGLCEPQVPFPDTASHVTLSTVPPTITPVLTPSLGGFLTPLSAHVMPVTSASIQVCNVICNFLFLGQFLFLRLR